MLTYCDHSFACYHHEMTGNRLKSKQFQAGNFDQRRKKLHWKTAQIVVYANSLPGIMSVQTRLDNWDNPT